MRIDSKTGLFVPVQYLPSPHCNERPSGMLIDMIVIHGISLPPAQFGTGMVEKFFCGELDTSLHPYFVTIANLRVSAHLFINRAGHLTQFVPFHLRAWHAGVSNFAGRSHCNDFSIGIELEGTDDLAYEPAQYKQLVQVIERLMIHYPRITRERIVGHSEIAPGRKTDPGDFFDWSYLEQIERKEA